jgi:integrase
MRNCDGRSRKRKRLHEEHWPSADRALWKRAFESGDVFDQKGAGAHLAPRTRSQLEYAYGRWIAHLAATDAHALRLTPFSRVTSIRVRGFATALLMSNSPRSTAIVLRCLRRASIILGAPLDLRWITAMASRLEAAVPPRSKHDRVRTSRELLSLGMKLMHLAEARRNTGCTLTIKDAQLYRDGLLIALLARVPLRRSNLAHLHLEGNLHRVGGEWIICLSADATKNGREYEAFLGQLSSEVDHFLRTFRPMFYNAEKHSALWPSIKGVPLTGNAIYDLIVRRTKAHFGQAVNPHLFRDGAATFWALETPRTIEGASALLGHSNLRTLKHYNQARSVAAGRRLAALLEQRETHH